MASTFKNLQDDVLDNIQELQGVADVSLVRVKRMLNRAHQRFCRDTDCFVKTLDITTVSNQEFYDSNDDANLAYMYKIIWVKYVEETTEFGVTLQPYPGGHKCLPKTMAYGDPSYYYLRGLNSNNDQKIGTYPIISTASETLRVHGCTIPITDLSTDGSFPVMQDEYRDAMVFYTVWRMFQAYSHVKPEWRRKAMDNKAFYEELVQLYRFQNYEDDLGGIQVVDAYAQY